MCRDCFNTCRLCSPSSPPGPAVSLQLTASNVNAGAMVLAILPSANPSIISFISPLSFPTFSLSIIDGSISMFAVPSLSGSSLLQAVASFGNLSSNAIQLAYSSVSGLSFGVAGTVNLPMPKPFIAPASVSLALSGGGGIYSFTGAFTGSWFAWASFCLG